MADNNTNIVAKKTRGKQKIEMKKIEKETDMITTFSKRKSGIYKKVNELMTLTGNEVGFLVFSPAGKPFSFGHPSFKDLALRYLGQQTEPQFQSFNGAMLMQARIQELNLTYDTLLDLMEDQHEKETVLMQKLEGKQLNNWWNKVVEDIQVGELSNLESAYSELLMKVEKRRMEMVSFENDMPSLNINMNDCFNTSSSVHVMHPYHQLMDMGQITSSHALIVGQLDGGNETALGHSLF